jgi:GntR family histidine utilization transcriptional repressor
MSEPTWKKIAKDIIDSIKAKKLKTNDKILSEHGLSDQYQVSRMTARKAIDQLVNEGILFRVHGKGTFVSNISAITSTLEIKNIADEIQNRGQHTRLSIIELKQTDAPRDIQHLFDAQYSLPFYSLMIHYEDELPVQVEERWVNSCAVPFFLEQDFTQMTTNHYLSVVAPLEKARHRIQATTASETQAEFLAMKAGEPCLQIVRHSYSNNQLISFARLTHPADRFQLSSDE